MGKSSLSAIVGISVGSMLVEYFPHFFNGHVLVVLVALVTAGATSLPLGR